MKKRNKKQYNQFRKAFKKWCKKYRPQAHFFRMRSNGVEFFSKELRLVGGYYIDTYHNYIIYTLRGLKRN